MLTTKSSRPLAWLAIAAVVACAQGPDDRLPEAPEPATPVGETLREPVDAPADEQREGAEPAGDPHPFRTPSDVQRAEELWSEIGSSDKWAVHGTAGDRAGGHGSVA